MSNKTIKYTAKIDFVSDDYKKNVEICTQASTPAELLKNLEEILNSKKKNCILKIFGL